MWGESVFPARFAGPFVCGGELDCCPGKNGLPARDPVGGKQRGALVGYDPSATGHLAKRSPSRLWNSDSAGGGGLTAVVHGSQFEQACDATDPPEGAGLVHASDEEVGFSVAVKITREQ